MNANPLGELKCFDTNEENTNVLENSWSAANHYLWWPTRRAREMWKTERRITNVTSMQERCQDSGHATAEALRWCGRGEHREPWTGLQMALETLLLEICPSFQCLEPQQSCSASPHPNWRCCHLSLTWTRLLGFSCLHCCRGVSRRWCNKRLNTKSLWFWWRKMQLQHLPDSCLKLHQH